MLRKIFNAEITILAIVSLAIGLVGFFQHNDTSPTIRISYRQTPEVGEIIVVSFPPTRSQLEALESFSLSPATPGELQWIEEYHELLFVPIEGFDPNKSYEVTIKQPSLFAQLTSAADKHTFQPEKLPTRFHARASNNQIIYYVTESGLKRSITSEVFHSYPNNQERNIRLLDQQTIDLYPDNNLVRFENRPDVYKLENGSKRLIQNAETFNALGFDWNTVAPVNQFEFDSYPNGEAISLSALPHQKASQGKFIDVNLQSMELTMWENGQAVGKVPVAGTGNPRTSPTRKGFFTILSKEENHLSSLSRVWMPWSMRYSGDYYIHGWPYWPNGSKLTSKYSAGCVRLFDNDIKKVYEFSEVGTSVLIR
ncbi:MAG: L,D-transpeptidase [Candidatus Taylorbacteria bacterium]|nr:L,D-transpeptidase [Candidatus Taylorbacteria bacterium]